METQVKERLTGAIVLVGVLVFLVPELLTGPKGGSRAPAQAAPPGSMRSYTIDLTEGAESRQATAPVPDAPAESIEALSPDDEQVSAGADPAEGETDGLSDAESSEAQGEEPALQPAAKTASGTSMASSPSGASQSGDVRPPGSQAGANKTAEPKTTSPQPADSDAKAGTSKSAATTKTAAAEQPAPQKSGAAKPTADKGWSVQVGSFASRANADRLASRLQGKGFKAFVTEAVGSPKLYRVRIGPQPDRSAAQAMATRLKGAGHPGTLVAPP